MKFCEWMRLAGLCPHAPLGVIARNEKEGYEYSSEQGRQHRFSKETVPDTWVDLTRILGLDCSLAGLLRYGSHGGVCKRKRKIKYTESKYLKGRLQRSQSQFRAVLILGCQVYIPIQIRMETKSHSSC